VLYRREIDGLRALAVLPVILHHANAGWIGGGYVGVDVFFVISGYLIASIIFAELGEGRFTLAGFYERRARRILPALALVALACVPPALLWMTKDQLDEFFESLVAVALFASNFLFWEQSGYFSVAAETKPLLHTWSLAVEEQFYLLFPLLALLLWRLPRRLFAAALAILALASLAYGQVLLSEDPTAAFYWTPTRIWELLLGVLLAMAERDGLLRRAAGTLWAELLAALGLASIVASFFLFDPSTPFPGVAALLPTLGTCLVLGFAREGTQVARWLGWGPAVGIGLISYSAYLWHQPLFAFARLRSLNEPSEALYAALALASLGLAWLSWRFVERPFRDRRRVRRRTLLAWVVPTGVLVLAIGLAGRLSGIADVEARYALTPDELAAIEPDSGNDAVEDCAWETPLERHQLVKTCRFGAPQAERTVVLLGDSHAEALLSALGEAFAEANIAGLLLQNGYCSSIAGLYDRADVPFAVHENCLEAHAAVVAYLRALPASAVLLSNRWTFALYPVRGEIESLDFDNGEGGNARETERVNYAFAGDEAVTDGAPKARALREFVDSLLAAGLPVVLVYPVPEVGWNVAEYNFKHLIAGKPIPQSLSTDYQRFVARNRFATALLDGIEGGGAPLLRVHPADVLCNSFFAGRCAAQVDGRPLYSDDDHLSDLGAALVAEQILRALPER